MSYEDIMKKLSIKCHFTIIYRRGLESMRKLKQEERHNEWCLEVSFATLDKDVEYFLWLQCKEELVDKIVKKFKLELL